MNISKKEYLKGLNFRLAAAGILMLVLFVTATVISKGFGYEIGDQEKPIITLVILLLLAGLFYFWAVKSVYKSTLSIRLWVFVIFMGLLFRLCMFFSVPMLEDDHYRYLWDGGVLANGFNPYKYAPADLADREDIPGELIKLSREYREDINKINYPYIKTIYPMLTQAGFAIAYFLSPWSLNSWRVVLLFFDIASLLLILLLLKKLDINLSNIVIYWWNPLLIREIYNSGHMEVMLFPFIIGAILVSINRRYLPASFLLGLAVNVKMWPAVLFPFLFKSIFQEPKKTVSVFICFFSLVCLGFLPFYFGGLSSESGLVAYSRQWEMNDSIFMILFWGFRLLVDLTGISSFSPQSITRLAVAAVILFLTFYKTRKMDKDPKSLVSNSLFIIAAIFLLSPTQFPWYALWLLPFLTIYPRNSLLLLYLLLPIYYLRYYFKGINMVDVFDNGIVWIEFVPVWCLLVAEYFIERRKKAACSL